MSHLRPVILYCLFTAFFCTCKSKEDHLLKVEGAINYETHIYEIQRDRYLPAYTTYCNVFNIGQSEYLGWVNNVTNSLDIFDLENGKLIDRVWMDEMGDMLFQTRADPKIKGLAQFSTGELLLVLS